MLPLDTFVCRARVPGTTPSFPRGSDPSGTTNDDTTATNVNALGDRDDDRYLATLDRMNDKLRQRRIEIRLARTQPYVDDVPFLLHLGTGHSCQSARHHTT